MTGKNIRIEVAKDVAVNKGAFQNVIGANRPYYWSWYRIVFEEPNTPVGGAVKTPPG